MGDNEQPGRLMVYFVVDRALDKLLLQINQAAPNRSKKSDGSIGDPDHAARQSGHNPEDTRDADAPGNPDEQVDARDITHDPAHGADMGVVTESIRKSKDRRLKFMIFNRRICSGNDGPKPWVWRSYSGINPHDKHAHFEVEDDTHDQTQDWQIGIDDMALSPEDLTKIGEICAKFVWQRDNCVVPPPAGWPDTTDKGVAGGTVARSTWTKVDQLGKAVAAIAANLGGDLVDEDEIASLILAGLGSKSAAESATLLKAVLTDEQVNALIVALAESGAADAPTA